MRGAIHSAAVRFREIVLKFGTQKSQCHGFKPFPHGHKLKIGGRVILLDKPISYCWLMLVDVGWCWLMLIDVVHTHLSTLYWLLQPAQISPLVGHIFARFTPSFPWFSHFVQYLKQCVWSKARKSRSKFIVSHRHRVAQITQIASIVLDNSSQ